MAIISLNLLGRAPSANANSPLFSTSLRNSGSSLSKTFNGFSDTQITPQSLSIEMDFTDYIFLTEYLVAEVAGQLRPLEVEGDDNIIDAG
ncbi:MAG: hypothetical protein QXO25_02035 [Candidatus Bathyarchaeia archaeon]